MSLYTIYVDRSQFGRPQRKLSPSAVQDERAQSLGVENVTSAAGGTLLQAPGGSLEASFDRVVTEKTWELAYREQASPTLVQGPGGDMPADGMVWVDPSTGTVLQTTIRLHLSPTVTHEVAVTYRQTEKAGGVWVPAEMRETITGPDVKLECLARYSNIRRFQVATDVQIPK